MRGRERTGGRGRKGGDGRGEEGIANPGLPLSEILNSPLQLTSLSDDCNDDSEPNINL